MFPTLQTSGSEVDGDAVFGNVPAVLLPHGDARLLRVHGRHLPLEQDRLGSGSGGILLGLLLHSDPGRTRQ